MPGAHRDSDKRFCGARTVVSGQSTVFVNSLLWAVDGDPNTHGGGLLVAKYGKKNIYINKKLIIVAVGDEATPDGRGHRTGTTNPLGRSGNVFAYDSSNQNQPIYT